MANEPVDDDENALMLQNSVQAVGAEIWEAESRAGLELLIALRLPTISRAWVARATRLFKDGGYTASQRAPLYVLARAPDGLTQTALAAALQISNAALSRRLIQSISDGLVSRHPVQGDARANLVRLEQPGRDALDLSDRIAGRDRSALFRGLADEDLKTTLAVLKTLSLRISGAPV